MRQPYAVLGCGPAGLLAAHALSLYNREFIILSPRIQSKLGGAQYCHAPIIGLTSEAPAATLTYHVRGDADTYREKVYGSADVPFVSFTNQDDGKQVPAWPLIDVYEQLWRKYEPQIVDVALNYSEVDDLTRVFKVISSAPLDTICSGTHSFRSQTVLISNDTHDWLEGDNTIVYSGDPADAWYRQSLIFGTPSTEYGAAAAIPAGVKVKQVRKPIATDCGCHPSIIKVGRYGRWEKGVLTHQGFGDLMSRLDAGELP